MKKNEIEIKKSNQDINKRTEIEKELNIQRNGKNRKKGLNASDIKMNHLNYYNEIAKNNIHNLMNNPTLKEIERITSNESVFDQLKAKEHSKDLSKFLDNLPLKRVERINYKGKEIGKMRKSLGVYCQDNPYVFIDKERAGKFASHLFEKRKREASANYKPVESIDNLYKKDLPKKKSDTFNFNNLTNSNNESWIQKHKRNGNSNNKFSSNQNNRFNTEVSDSSNIENNKFVKTKIEVNKNKSNYRLYKGKDKMNEYLINRKVIQTNGNGNEIGRSFTKNERNRNLNINTFHISNKRDNNNSINNNIYKNGNYNNVNNMTNNDFPKRTLTMNLSENKVKLDSRHIQNNYTKNNHKELSIGEKRTLNNNIKINSTSNIYGRNNLIKKKEENENRINVRIRRRNENNYKNNERTNIKVKKNEEIVKRNDNRGYRRLNTQN